jgi:ABC-type oligopeptide transport system substrate-binding subunit
MKESSMKHIILAGIIIASSMLLSACSTEVVEEEIKVTDSKEILKDQKAREAIALTIDKKFIANDIYSDGSYAADFFVPRDFVDGPSDSIFEEVDFRDGANTYLKQDVDLAIELWNQVKKEHDFQEVTIKILASNNELTSKVLESIKSDLEENLAGIYIELVEDESDYDIKWNGWGPDYLDPLTFLELFKSNGSFNETYFSSEKYDELINQVNSHAYISNLETRWELLREAEGILLNEVGVVPIIQRNEIALYSPNVTKWVEHTLGATYSFKAMESMTNDVSLAIPARIESFDSAFATDSTTSLILGNVLEGLFVLGVEDTIEFGVIKSFIKTEDGLTYTFEIDENAYWVTSSGIEFDSVTAHDFVYGWDRLITEGSPYSYLLSETAQIDEYYAVDDYTFEIKLKNEVPYLTSLLTLPVFAPVNEKYVGFEGDLYGNAVDTVLYNGAYYLNETSDGYHLIKNDLYHQESSVRMDDIHLIVETDQLIEMYLNGDIDRVSLNGSYVSEYKNREDARVVSNPHIFYLTFNLE